MSVKQIYHNVNHYAFWTCLIISIGLIIGSFFVPPLGVIDGSVLAGVGELFAFATLATVIVAIMKGSDVTVQHNNTSISVNNPDPDKKSDNR